MSDSTETKVRTLLINPIGKSEPMVASPPVISPVNYYFFLFDIPRAEGNILFSNPVLDSENEALTFEFSYQGIEPDDDAPMATHMRSFFSQELSSLENYTVSMKEVKSDGTKKTRSKGVILKPKTVELFGTRADYVGTPNPGIDEIRYQAVLSTSVTTTQYYFLIIMSKTTAGDHINRMSLEPGNSINSVSCYYEPRPSNTAQISSDYVAAAAFLELPCPVTEPATYPIVNSIEGINSGLKVSGIDYTSNVISL